MVYSGDRGTGIMEDTLTVDGSRLVRQIRVKFRGSPDWTWIDYDDYLAQKREKSILSTCQETANESSSSSIENIDVQFDEPSIGNMIRNTSSLSPVETAPHLKDRGVTSELKRRASVKKAENGGVVETKAYFCPDCGMKFSWKSYLERHVQTHSGIKPYECNVRGCEYRTSQIGNLKMHHQIHTGVRPHACDWPDCTYRSIHPGNLKNHKLTHAGVKLDTSKRKKRAPRAKKMENGEIIKPKSHSCPECSKEFPWKSYLERHAQTHRGVKPYECDFPGCAYRTGQTVNLKMHQRTHTGLSLCAA